MATKIKEDSPIGSVGESDSIYILTDSGTLFRLLMGGFIYIEADHPFVILDYEEYQQLKTLDIPNRILYYEMID